MLWNLQVARRQKIGVIFLFCIGIVALVGTYAPYFTAGCPLRSYLHTCRSNSRGYQVLLRLEAGERSGYLVLLCRLAQLVQYRGVCR